MNLLETFQMAVKNILSSKVRTLLTMPGIIIGVCAVIVIVGLGNGMQGYIEESFADMGTDSLTVQILGRGSSRSVSEEQMYALVSGNQDLYKQISPTVTMMGAVKIGSDSISTSTVTGVSEDYFDMKGYTIAQGRNLDYVDIAGRKKVCVVGQYLNMAYFGGNAVGQTIRVNGTSFTVVGIMSQKGSELEEGGTDDCIFLPYSTAARLSFTGAISSYTITVRDTDNISEAKTVLENRLYDIFSDEDAYTVISMAEMLDSMNSMVNMMICILAGIAAIGSGRHRHYEYHAGIRHGTDAGNRDSQGAGSQRGRDHAAVRHGGGHHLGAGRPAGHRAGLRTFVGGYHGDRHADAGYPHHRQPQRRSGGGGLRSFGGDRHCVRLPACPESGESEPHRCIALRLIPFCKGRSQFLTAAFARYALRRKTEKIRSNLRLAQQIPGQKTFFNIFHFFP